MRHKVSPTDSRGLVPVSLLYDFLNFYSITDGHVEDD